MASLKMKGPYVLSPDKINEVVTQKSAGNFALGYISETDFIVLYVGRSDVDLNEDLQMWVNRKSDCLFFKYAYAACPQAAFEKECKNFHDFDGSIGLSNDKHPEPNKNTDWKCPICKK